MSLPRLVTLRARELPQTLGRSRQARLHSRPGSLRPERLEFHAIGESSVRNRGGSIKVTSADGVIACAKAGLGIAVASRWMCRAELEAGEVVAILSDYQLDWVELYAVYPGGRRPSLKVRTFSDYLAAQLRHKMKAGEELKEAYLPPNPHRNCGGHARRPGRQPSVNFLGRQPSLYRNNDGFLPPKSPPVCLTDHFRLIGFWRRY